MQGIGLRIGQVTLTHPTVLADPKSAIKLIFEKTALVNLPNCNLNGGGTWSWLLDFDLMAGQVKTGGAIPVSDPHQGYCFTNKTLGGTGIVPVSVNFTGSPSGGLSTSAFDMNMPVFLSITDTNPLIVPIKKLSFSSVVLSADHNCIGSYNAAEFTAKNLCTPDETQRYFTDGGTLAGHIDLEEADATSISAAAQSLCVLLSNNLAMYGDGAMPITHCKRDANGKILFQGDWCTKTNAPADASCADAVIMSGTFAASSVQISGDCP
jgi:hypothetical protein